LGDGPYHNAPSAFRELESLIFEQLSETETLEKRVSRRDDLVGAVLEGLADAVLVFDRTLSIRFANPSAAKLFGWDSPPIGERATDCIRDFKLVEMVENCVVHSRRESAELVLSDSGSKRILEADIAPMLSNDVNTVTRARAVLHDVTDARELEQVRKDFVANASHELRTPLTIINGYIENLMEGGIEDREMATRFLTVMQKHGHRIARIIEDMLTISKLESHVEVLQCERFDLRVCAEEVVARLAPVIEQKRAKIRYEFPADAAITGDPFYWDQILFNLIENALKENDAPELNITISLRNTAEVHQICVTDNGVGIPKATQAYIFKRFYRVDQDRSAEKKGTGLGLSIVKRALQAHGGDVAVDSTPGQSTRFIMTIPSGLGTEKDGEADQDDARE
jgi:PAS domain S-box-containing protein